LFKAFLKEKSYWKQPYTKTPTFFAQSYQQLVPWATFLSKNDPTQTHQTKYQKTTYPEIHPKKKYTNKYHQQMHTEKYTRTYTPKTRPFSYTKTV